MTAVLGRSDLVARAQLPTTLVLACVIVLWAAICRYVPGLIPFVGIAVPILFSQHLVDRSLDRNASLLPGPGRPSA